MFFKIDVSKDFAKFIGKPSKTPVPEFIFSEDACLQLHQKKGFTQLLSCKFSEIMKNIYFTEHSNDYFCKK